MSEQNKPINNNKKYNIIISVLGVLVVGASSVAGFGFYKANEYKNELEQNYMRALETTVTNVSNITTDLNKGIYATSPSNIAMLSSKLWKESSSAKAALSALPVTELNLENTYKFLSQIGDYAMALSSKALKGQDISTQEQENFSSLLEYSKKISEHVESIHKGVSSGQINIENVRMEAKNYGEDGSGNEGSTDSGDPASSTLSLTSIEDGFTDYPKLIYDGPFSDHILDKKSEYLVGLDQVSKQQARQMASKALGVDITQLKDGFDENSNTASYTFGVGNDYVAITKQGGLVNYMIKDSLPSQTRVSTEQALDNAENYLEILGIEDMEETYYEVSNNIMTINYAYTLDYNPDDVICYTDLIKVGVDMETGYIVSYDARGFIMNHKVRNLPANIISEKEAKSSVHDSLKILETDLALIPTSGQNEVLVYEFLTQASDGQKILEYINAKTGMEEQQLLLFETQNGTLTK